MIGTIGNYFNSDFNALFETKVDAIYNKNKLKNYKLVIFTGGADISPTIYNEKNWYCGGISDYRDSFELAMLKESLKLNLKILGVCRGHQLINAFLGGSLYQDLNIQVSPEFYEYDHDLENTSGLLKNINHVNSYHHQGIKKLAPALYPVATYKNIIEATQSFDNKILTVQFHPEWMPCDLLINRILNWIE